MIDLAFLASSAITALIPMLKKGIETFTGDASKNLYQWVANKLASKNKQKDLEALKANPSDQRVQGKVESTIEDILNEHPTLVNELSKLIEASNKEAVNISNSKNVVTGPITTSGTVIVGDNNTLNTK